MFPEYIPNCLIPRLQAWAVSGVSHSKVDDLKFLSNVFNFLPRSSRGLLHIPHHTEVDVERGEIWFTGIHSNLQNRLTHEYLMQVCRVVLDIGIDGIPLTESGINDFWPFMVRLEGDLNSPFLISVFCGPGKPSSSDDYFSKYCTEVLELQESGIEFNGVIYPFKVRHDILDAMAR